ncbi:hypothetical protein ACFYZT_24665 [Streptomyces sp. NPDC001591]|uniref:hypothetical protein n=1 Tax=Streptomyces sp. NPDC001591 TaxID=3364589 RepID=UPI0036B598D2
MDRVISASAAPALGDVRAMKTGDTVHIDETAPQRRDWTRYADAIAHAVRRGADSRWERR